MSWNPVLNLIIEIKNKYIEKFGEITYDGIMITNENGGKEFLTCLEAWIYNLKIQEYMDFIEPLQVNQCNNLVIIRYGISGLDNLTGMWEDVNSIYRECRSVVINIEKDELVATPFRKFFNINEVEENKEDILGKEIANANVFEISNKLDGSMQSARYYNGEIKLFGSMALNMKNSWRVEQGYNLLTNNHKQMLIDNSDMTFIFEYIGEVNQHVVLYKDINDIFLIGIRDVLTGRELTYKEVKTYADEYHIKMTKIESISVDEMMRQMKNANAIEKEGWVLNIDGHKVKIKCDDYCNVHRILDKSASVNVVIKSVADNTYDDLISKVPKELRGRIDFTKDMVLKFVNEKEAEIQSYYNSSPKNNRKEFMVWVDMIVPKRISGFVKNKFLNKEYDLLRKRQGYLKWNDMYNESFENYYAETLKEVIND